MSDYLDRLVSRSLAPAAEVRPRVPSVFESRSGPAILPPNAGLEVNEESITTTLAPSVKDSPASTGPESLVPSVVSAVAPRPGPPTTAAESPVAPRPLAHPEITVAPPSPVARAPAEAAHDPAAIRPAVSPSLSPETRPTFTPPPNRAPPLDTPPAVVTRSEPSPVSFPVAPRVEAKTLEPPAFAPIVRPVLRPQESAVTPQIRPSVTLRETPASGPQTARRTGAAAQPPSAATSPQPSIQVTIGRVEVRASSPASPPLPARVKKEPALSLESYLRRRAEGGRR